MFKRDVQPIYNISNAEIILSAQSDFLHQGAGAMAYARQFADRRDADLQKINLDRLYAIESTPTLTGVMADHRVMCHQSEIDAFLYVLLQRLENKKFSSESTFCTRVG